MPWRIALNGLSFKSTQNSVVQEMIMAIIDSKGWFGGMSCADEAKRFPLAWTDLVKKAKTAAGKFLFLLFLVIPCS